MLDNNDQPIPMSDNIDELPPFFRWGRLMEQAANKRGRVLQLGPKLSSFQRNAGLLDIKDDVYQIRTGTWAADPQQRMLGARMMLSALQGMEGFTTAMFTKSLGWSLEDTQSFVEEAKRDLRDDYLRKVIDLHVVYGQKPGGKKMKKEVPPEEAWKGLLGSQSVQFAGGVLLGGAIASVLATWLMRRR